MKAHLKRISVYAPEIVSGCGFAGAFVLALYGAHFGALFTVLVTVFLTVIVRYSGADQRGMEARVARLDTIANAMPDLISYITPDRRYAFNNRAYWEWFHRDPESLKGESIGLLVDKNAFAEMSPRVDSAFRGQTVRFTADMPTPVGTRVSDVLYVPDRAGDGSVRGIVTFVRDITQRRRAQEQLMQEVRVMEALNRAGARLAGLLDLKRLLQEIADSGTEITGAEVGAVFYLPEPERADGPVCYAAAGALEFLSDVGKPLFGDSRHLSEALAQRAGRPIGFGGGPNVDEYFERVFGKALEVRSYLSVPLVSSLGRCVGLLCFAHRQSGVFDERADRVAESLSTQAAIALGSARLYEELEQAMRLKDESLAELARSNSELQQFAYIASHDLKEPLRMVTSYVRLIEKRYLQQFDSDGREFLQFAVEGATRMHSLINDLLAYSRVGTQGVVFQQISSETVVRDALKNLETAIEESGAQIEWHDLPQVSADPTQLVQLFQNLIGNAIKYRGAEVPRIRISAYSSPDRWRFEVKDNGIGIEPQFWQRVFVVFQRLHAREQYPGTGIGLSICKKIIERHGGDIWLESQPGEGATFYFTLPKRAVKKAGAAVELGA